MLMKDWNGVCVSIFTVQDDSPLAYLVMARSTGVRLRGRSFGAQTAREQVNKLSIHAACGEDDAYLFKESHKIFVRQYYDHEPSGRNCPLSWRLHCPAYRRQGGFSQH